MAFARVLAFYRFVTFYIQGSVALGFAALSFFIPQLTILSTRSDYATSEATRLARTITDVMTVVQLALFFNMAIMAQKKRGRGFYRLFCSILLQLEVFTVAGRLREIAVGHWAWEHRWQSLAEGVMFLIFFELMMLHVGAALGVGLVRRKPIKEKTDAEDSDGDVCLPMTWLLFEALEWVDDILDDDTADEDMLEEQAT